MRCLRKGCDKEAPEYSLYCSLACQKAVEIYSPSLNVDREQLSKLGKGGNDETSSHAPPKR